MNYYEILGVPVDAPVDEIQQAYRVLARKVHPDLNGGDGGRAEARMKQLNEIRDTLTDPLLRSAYDAELAKQGGPRGEHAAAPADSVYPPPAAPPASVGRRGHRPFAILRGPLRLLAGTSIVLRLVLGLVLVGGVLVVTDEVLGLSPFQGGVLRRTLRSALDRLGSALPSAQQGATREPAPPAPPRPSAGPSASKRGPASKGVVKLGSTAAEVIRALGPPDRTEPGGRGSVYMVYGQLRFELRNGVVVGGGM